VVAADEQTSREHCSGSNESQPLLEINIYEQVMEAPHSPSTRTR